MASPASSGPAGSLFESQVGAYYLLSLLAGSEPRGLPGWTVARVEFQRAGEERHLDDVIVHAQNAQGKTAVLEIQVKRELTFAPSDDVFKDVVGQIAAASRRPDFWNSKYELAVATAKRSRQIDGPYQDVLTWAREIGDATTFHARILRAGSGNDNMRAFISTFRAHLQSAGAPYDDETVWALLRRFQILVFDFTAQGSASEELAKERAIHILHSDDANRAGNLWSSLNTLAFTIAASGGDRTRERLLEDLRPESFRFIGERRFFSVRAALAEATDKALTDMETRVGNVMLTRHEHIAAIHTACDEGRYVEIRGNAGVGKSGVLRHFAEQVATEGQVIVLSPSRTIPKGWLALKSALGFDGSAHALLSDLATDGGAILFIDNLDSFGVEERLTVIDLVREAAKVPHFLIIATARQSFGVDEPNWLPIDVLNQLGRATPVVIGELSDSEINELRDSAPRLKALLANNHPARDVVRNLFRLARLAEQASDDPIPRTEIDMAEQWWKSADGKDTGRRERARVIRAMAERALSLAGPVDVSTHPATPIEALVASGTLRDLGNDRMIFRHDVLREWAIANLLFTDATLVERLPFDRPASSSLARGVELAARMMIERATDSISWHTLLTSLSRDGAHGTWRRAALLALVHSEVGTDLLKRASTHLLADDAKILKELIRTMMAVDVEPITERLAAAGADPKVIPVNLNVPRGASWLRLLTWLLILDKDLPAVAIPDAVNVYTKWSMGTIGLDPLTPRLLHWLYLWLNEIEESREGEWRTRYEVFGGVLDREQLASLESALRTGFLLFCNQTPELAAQYLQSLMQRNHNDEVVRSVLKFRGALASAVPKELAEFTAAALIQEEKLEPEYERRYRHERAFGFIDHEFLPPSPNQGPFLELLTAAPEHGLPLIRRLVDYDVSFRSRGQPHGNNNITIYFPDGERVFPWEQTYMWSREKGTSEDCVKSALMALEAWAHRRIEAGEPFDKVLNDVLGSSSVPACFLLVAVDLLISHWPKSREAAVPFLSCPELLCIDRERKVHDHYEYPDIFGIKGLQKEPGGASSVASLQERASRRYNLEELIGQYAVHGPDELRATLTTNLRREAERLGPPDTQSDLSDPAFTVLHALNLADPANWPKATVTLKDGSTTTVRQYVPPESEAKHLEPIQEAHKERVTDANMQMTLSIILNHPERASPEFAEAAVTWAQNAKTQDGDEDEQKMRDEAICIAALVAVRDGSAELRTQHAAWIRETFALAMQSEDDSVHWVRSGLRYNPIAIAFVGMVLLLKDAVSSDDILVILEVAARDNPAAAHGFAAVADTIAALDERLPRAILRCAFATRIKPNRGLWDERKKNAAARARKHQRQVKAAVDAEIAWLNGTHPEPEWPQFPVEPARPKRRLRVPGGKKQPEECKVEGTFPDQYVESQGAALWLKSVVKLSNVVQRPWLRDIAQTYSAWTMAANGAGLALDDDVSDPPTEWNNTYFDLLAHCLPGLDLAGIDELALTPIASLPDESFFDAIATFLPSIDHVYFNDRGLEEAQAIHIRAAFTRRMMTSRGWYWLARDRAYTIEFHIAPALGAIFFNEYMLSNAKCYLLSKGVDRLHPFLPTLQELVTGGPCLFLAIVTLNLIEVSPRAAHLPFVIAAGNAWLTGYSSDNTFWIEHSIGRRLCAWFRTVLEIDGAVLSTDQSLRTSLEYLLAGLVRCGVPEAHRLEEDLKRGPKNG